MTALHVFQLIAVSFALWSLIDVFRSRKRYTIEREKRMRMFQEIEKEYLDRLTEVKRLEAELREEVKSKEKKKDIDGKEKLRNVLEYVDKKG